MYLLSSTKENRTLGIGFDKLKSSEKLRIRYLGRVSLAKTMTPLSSSLVFVGKKWFSVCIVNHLFHLGSERDNSQLLQVTEENTGDREMPSLIVCESFSNLGFVSDLKLVRNETNSTASLLAASFQKKHQQVNMLRSGINLKIQNVLELPTVKNFWLIKGYEDSFFFVSTSKETIPLRINNEKFKIYTNHIDGFEEKRATLSINEIRPNLFAQITSNSVGLFQIQEMKTACVYSSKPGSFDQYGDIVLSANFEKDLYIVTKNKILVHLDFENSSTLDNVSEKALGKQVSALAASKNFIFLSYWHENQLLVLDRDNLSLIATITCEKHGIASIYSSTLGTEQFLYLYVGHFDGLVEVYQYTFMKDGKEYNFQITGKNCYKIGSQPISLQEHKLKGKVHVLASCDNSASFYVKEHCQLSYVHLLKDNIKKIVPWSLSRENHYFILSDGQISVGYAETADKLQAKPLPFDARDEITFLLSLSEQNLYVAAVNNTQEETGFLKFYDSNSYSEIESIKYENSEISSLLYFEYEEFRGVLVSIFAQTGGGRVEVIEIKENSFYRQQVINFEKEVLLLSKLSSQCVVAALPTTLVILQIEKSNKTFLEDFAQETYSFKEVLIKSGHSLIWQLHTLDNFLLVVDRIKGVNLYLFNMEDKKLNLISKSAISSPGSESGCILDENRFFLVSENTLRILKKNLAGESEPEKMMLQVRDYLQCNV